MKVIFTCFIALGIMLGAFGQAANRVPIQHGSVRHTFKPVSHPYQKTDFHQSTLRGFNANPLFLDYFNVDATYANNKGGMAYYDPQAAVNANYPNSAAFTYTFAAAIFDTLMTVDTSGNIITYSLDSSSISLDSVDIAFILDNAIQATDTIKITVFNIDSAYISGQGDTSTLINNSLWDTLIIVNGNLPGNLPFGSDTFTDLTFYPGLYFNKGTSFGVRVDFSGDTASHFNLGTGFIDLCNANCAAAPSVVGLNSFFYVNLINQGNNLSGIDDGNGTPFFYDCDQSGMYDSSACELIQNQDWFIWPSISRITSISTGIAATTVSCYGDSSGNATALPSGGVNYTYTWSNSQTTDTAVGLTAGTYTVTVNSYGLSASASVTITQPDSALAVSVAYSADFDSNGVATATATGGVSPYTYAWSNGDSTASIDSLAAATYYVTVTDNNGCVVVDSATIVTGINSLSSFISDVSLFPNPANESLTVSVQTANTLKIQLRVTDVTGKIMYAREQTVKGKMNQQLDLTPYALGVYFLELISGQQSVKKSFVVTH